MNGLFEATLGQWEFIVRIVIAAVCGGAIGLERSHRQKEAGIRTHIIVALGSALLTIISKYGFFDVIITDSISLDASRLAANVITGISFLGAGVIFLKGGSIKGLTTAAGLWTTSGIGLALGAGMYTVGIFSTVLVVLAQYILHRYNLSSETVSSNEVKVICDNSEEAVAKVKDLFVSRNILVQQFSFHRNGDDTVSVTLTVRIGENVALDELMLVAYNAPEIKEISVTT